jgi:hypothetical protein
MASSLLIAQRGCHGPKTKTPRSVRATGATGGFRRNTAEFAGHHPAIGTMEGGIRPAIKRYLAATTDVGSD